MKILYYSKGSILCLFLLITIVGYGQSDKWDSLYNAIPEGPDSLRFQQLHDLSLQLAFTDEKYFLKVNKEASDLVGKLGERSYAEAKVFDAWAKYHTVFGTLDSTIYYWNQVIDIMEEAGHQSTVAKYKSNIGIINRRQGDYEAALQVHLESLRIFEELGDSSAIYRVHNALGGVYVQLDDNETAIFHFQKMLDNAIRNDQKLYQADGYTNIAAISQDSELAMSYLQKAIPIYKQLDKKSALIGTILKLAKSYSEQGNYNKEIELLNEAEPIVNELESELYRADLLREKGRTMTHVKRYDEAIRYLISAQEIYNAIGETADEILTYSYLYIAQAGAGRYKDAYESKTRHAWLSDSTKSIQVLENISELETKYETAKKDAEILVLNKNIEIQNVKRQRLWGGLALLSLAGLTLIYGIVQRNKRKQAILHQEKAIAIEKQEKAEQQLEFKKKELTAKALQLAKKNEFLQELESEVTELQSSVDSSVGKASSRISRMIQRDSVNDEEWEQFSAEFTSVHQGFLDRLRERFGSFSKGEMRLIYLLRMNMSSKEIASLLHISGDGVRKSRYRLRKKMGLDPSEDLQGLILGM